MIIALAFSTLLLSWARAEAAGLGKKGCPTSYRPDNILPDIHEYINFSDSNPLVVGAGPGQYNYYNTFDDGALTGNNFTSFDSFFLISNNSWNVSACGEMAASAIMGFNATVNVTVTVPPVNPILSPYGIDADPYYGAGWFGMVDVIQGWQLLWVLTRTRAYAWYERVGTPTNAREDALKFTYMVPLGERNNDLTVGNGTDGTNGIETGIQMNTYAIVLNPNCKWVSYRIDGQDKLIIRAMGTPIDNRFLLDAQGGSTAGAFPQTVQLLIGIGRVLAPGVPFTACQNALFNQCTQSIRHASNTYCTYIPVQDPLTFAVLMTLIVDSFGLASWQLLDDCLTDGLGDCRARPVDECCDRTIPCCQKEPKPIQPCCPQRGKPPGRCGTIRYFGNTDRRF